MRVVVRVHKHGECVRVGRGIPRPAGENAGLRDDTVREMAEVWLDLARVLSKSYEAAFEASVRCKGKTTANVVPFPSVLETSIRP